MPIDRIFLCAFLIGIFPLVVASLLLQASVNNSIEKIEQEAMDIVVQVSKNLNVISIFLDYCPIGISYNP